MALRARFYIFEEGGALKHVPRRVCEGLYAGVDALPEYAGTTQKVAQVIVENEGGKPARILDATGHLWTFDADGKIDEDQHKAMHRAMDFVFRAPKDQAAKVVDLRPEIDRKQWHKQYRWELSAGDLNRITADLWPGLADAEEVKSVKGKAPKAPTLTQDARSAIVEIHTKLDAIYRQVEDLSEQALKGFIYEAKRTARAYPAASHFWDAVAHEAEKQRDIKVRHRTGKGVFFAALTIWHEYEPGSSREIDRVEVRCDGKLAAIEAARHLLAENAHRYDEKVSLDVEVLSDLEWTPSVDDDNTFSPEQA